MMVHLLAAADTGSGNLIVGLILGLCIGLLVGPVFRSWLMFREWTETSREAKLTDRLVTKLETDAEEYARSSTTHEEPRTPNGTEPRTPAAWQTPR